MKVWGFTLELMSLRSPLSIRSRVIVNRIRLNYAPALLRGHLFTLTPEDYNEPLPVRPFRADHRWFICEPVSTESQGASLHTGLATSRTLN